MGTAKKKGKVGRPRMVDREAVRSRIIGVRLVGDELAKVERLQKTWAGATMSEVLRRCLASQREK